MGDDEELSQQDWGILAYLRADASAKNEQIGTAVGLSRSAVSRRRQRLADRKVLVPRVAVDHRTLGLGKTVYALVSLTNIGAKLAFERLVATQLPHCVEWASVSGGFDYLLKFLVASHDHYEEQQARLVASGAVKGVHTLYALGRVVDRHPPLPPAGEAAVRHFGLGTRRVSS